MEISLDTLTVPTLLLLHCNQINRVQKEVDGLQASQLACMQISDYKAAFTPMHFVFLELDKHPCHLDCTLLEESNNVTIPRTFYPELLENENEYM